MTKGITGRSSNFELLRLVALFMIVLIHANMYLSQFAGSNFALVNGAINGICNTGVTLFVLISGYFGVKCNIKKIVKLECMMITYSLMETVIIICFSAEALTKAEILEQLVKSLLPFISRKYWFYSSYVCLMIFSGYLDDLIEKIGRLKLKLLIATMLVIFSIFPSLFYFEIVMDNGKGVVQMLLIYLIGRYIGLYISDDFKMPRWMIIVVLTFWIINGISHEFPICIGTMWHHLCKDNSITNIIIAVCIFMWFRNFKFQVPAINFVAKYVFAIFALNNTLVAMVFPKIHPVKKNSLIEVALVLLIMVICILIGMVRELLLKRVDIKLGDFMVDSLIPLIRKKVNHIKEQETK